MKPKLRVRFWMYLERFRWINRLVFEYDGIAPSGYSRYIHRFTGHMELLEDWRVVEIPRYRGIY